MYHAEHSSPDGEIVGLIATWPGSHADLEKCHINLEDTNLSLLPWHDQCTD